MGEGAIRVTTPEVVEDTGEQAFQGEGSGARRLTTRRVRPPSLAALWAATRREAADQLARWPLWAPVAYGGGAAIYLALMDEPPLWLALVPSGLAVAACWLARRGHGRRGLVVGAALVAFLAAGFLTAKVRALRVASPVVPALRAAEVHGWVVDVAPPSQSGSG